jgi:hypothetical protein
VIRDLRVGASLLLRLPAFLRNPVTRTEALATLRRRLERREDDFLALVARGVYGQADSPYRSLLTHLGLAQRDLETLVRREGVEGALRALYRQGVYLTSDEFKGRVPVRRGAFARPMDQHALRNHAASTHLLFHTSGRTGQTQVVGIDLAQIRHESVDLRLFLDARGGERWVHGIYGAPGTSIVRLVMRLGSLGAPLARWFSQIDPAGHGLSARYRWSARIMRTGGALARVPIPSPEHIPLERPHGIVAWMTKVLDRGETPNLWALTSSAVRVCAEAAAAGVRLDGAQFTLLGEPVTAARLAAIRHVGAEAASYYSSVDSGHIAYACQTPAHPDDLHLLHDLYAVVQPLTDAPVSRLSPQALLVSTVSPAAPFIMLNVSLGDHATVEARTCGCPLERLGWTTHLHTIRSDEKITAGGMTLYDADIVRVLEEVLPSRFGGAPTHYQLVEDEDAAGRPRVRLLVHPAVGVLDPAAVVEAFLTAVGSGAGSDRVAELVWRGGRVLEVERSAPLATSGGKILHLLDGRTPRSE